MSNFKSSDYNGGFVGGVSFKETLGPKTLNHTCRLCDGYDLDFLGYSRMRVQDGFGSVDFYRCHRCNGTGIEPKSFIWDGTWYKPWTWFNHHYDWR